MGLCTCPRRRTAGRKREVGTWDLEGVSAQWQDEEAMTGVSQRRWPSSQDLIAGRWW